MGTNYYASGSKLSGHKGVVLMEDVHLHIGKSSGGWTFALHVIPELGLTDEYKWLEYIDSHSLIVEDEYGVVVSSNELWLVMYDRRSSSAGRLIPGWCLINHAEPGPNNLARRKIGWLCVGHSPVNPVDYLEGEFS